MNITRKCIIAALSAMLLAGSSSGALAASSLKTDVNGKALDDIHDIIQETNGAKPGIQKYSILTLPAVKAQNGNLGWDLRSINQNIAELQKYSSVQKPFGDETRFTTDHRGVFPVTAKYLTGKGKGRYVFVHDEASRTNNIAKFNAQLYLAGKKNNSAPTFTKIGSTLTQTIGSSPNGPSYIVDAKSGLRVDRGTDEEYVVVSSVRNTQQTTVNWCSAVLSFFRIAEDGDGNASFTASPLTVEAPHAIGYTPAQIAIGDFTGEGITNQVALTTTDKKAIYLTLYTIRKKSDGSLEAVKTKEETVYTYSGELSGNLDGFCALPVTDIAAGDFDGDGKTEIALTYKTNQTSVAKKGQQPDPSIRGSAVVKIMKWTNGAFKSESVTKDWNSSESPWTAPDATVSVAWLKPVTADLDGDGKDELAVVVALWTYTYSRSTFTLKSNPVTEVCSARFFMTFWSCSKGSISPRLNNENSITTGYSGNLSILEISRNSYDYPNKVNIPSIINVAAGPVRGKMGKFRTADDVITRYYALRWGDDNSTTINSGNREGLDVFYPADDNFSRWAGKTIITGRTYLDSTAAGIVADDFLCEGVELGEPSHVVVSDRWTPAASIQAPPYHLDTIPLEFWNYPQTWPVNFNYESSAKTTYSRSGKTTDAKDTKFEATSSLEAFGPLGIDIDSETMDSVKSGVKLAANFLTGSKTAGATITGLIDNFTDKVKATETKITNGNKSLGYTNTIEAGKNDSQLFYVTKTHVWRYPVKKPAPSWIIGDLQNGSAKAASGDLYITIIAPDEPSVGSSKAMFTRQGANAGNPLYQPTHEEGNLFSYPTTLGAIPGYSARQFSLIPRVMPISYSTNQEKHKASVATSTGKSESKSRQVTSYGQFSRVAGTLKTLRGKSSDMRPNTNTETFSRKFDSTEEIEVVYPDPSKAFDWRDVTFSSQFDLYVDESGIMTAGFAVTDLPNTAKLWGSDSPYWKKPDPALVMPDRYVFVDGKQEIGKSKQILPRTERDAMKLRGVRIYSKTLSTYANNTVYPGLSYEIQVPIYNASFLPSEGAKSLTVPMKLYYRKAGSDENGTLIGEPVSGTNNIGGWTKGTENNKALVRFNWDNVPALAQGAYEFYVVIDPDNKIDEVHEAWTAKTPDGNNTGYFPFGISHGTDTSPEMIAKDFVMKYKARGAKKGIASSAVRASDYDDEYEDWTAWEDWNDKTDFSNMVDGDTEFAVSVLYGGEDVCTDVWADVVMDFTDDDGEYEVCFASAVFPVIVNGDSIYFTFILNEEEIKNGKNLRLVVTEGDSSVEYLLDAVSDSGNEPAPQENDEQPSEQGNVTGIGSPSGGCGTVQGAFMLLVLSAMMINRKRS